MKGKRVACVMSVVFLSACRAGSSGGESDQTGQTDAHPVDSVLEDTVSGESTPGTDALPETSQGTDLLPDGAAEIVPDLAQPDESPGRISAEGYGTFCRKDGDCAQWGLTCFRWGPEDVMAVCSSPCQGSRDCPEYFPCDYKLGYADPPRICSKPRFCVACSDDRQCQVERMSCIADELGDRFCSYPCAPGTLGCPAGSRCTRHADPEGWFCMPFAGACLREGAHCDPCYVESHCQTGHHCIAVGYEGEKFCSKKCNTGTECPTGHSCFDLGLPTGMCLMVAGGEGQTTCHQGTQGFCQECRSDFECQSGHLCYVAPDQSGYYCTPECTSDQHCPTGSRCKGSWNSGTGLMSGFGCALQGEATCQALLEAELSND